MAHYLDSSAVVKYYVTEPGSVWLREAVDAEKAVILSEITTVEVAAALGILHRVGRIRLSRRRTFWDRFERDCATKYRLAPVVRDHICFAAQLCGKHPLRAYDALQLAAAMELRTPLAEQGVPLVFVSADDALVAASQSENLAVENPVWHTDRDAHNV